MDCHVRFSRSSVFTSVYTLDSRPTRAGRITVWEVAQHLIRSLDQEGEKETANLKAKIGGMLVYRPPSPSAKMGDGVRKDSR
jgi:hypothetical protein